MLLAMLALSTRRLIFLIALRGPIAYNLIFSFKIYCYNLMRHIFFFLLSLCMISPSFSMPIIDEMVLIPAGKSQMGSKESLLEMQ